MHIPRYWARSEALISHGKRKGAAIECWGWSDQAATDAKQKADARAKAASQRFLAGEALERYPYGQGDRPLREEIVQVEHASVRDGSAVITRNQYGALVLNAARAMFIDVDFDTHVKLPAAGGFFGRLFAKKPSPDELEKLSLEKIRGWSGQHPTLGMRVYRTAAGMRCLVTNQTFDPAGREAADLLQSIGSDPLYIRLCTAQACFRARLTPKPWRCAVGRPPGLFPRVDAELEMRFQKWKAEYEIGIADYSVSRLVEQIGTTALHPEIAPIVQLHDRFTMGGGDRPLA
jgi:hypothetical protein